MADIPLIIGLVGNPNCGKTTLFNALTGARQTVGNWPGVTVEKKTGSFIHDDKKIDIVDLPGIYSLDCITGSNVSVDEQVARDYVLSGEASLIINIVDASNLERNLYLTTQLLEIQVPVIIALNMTDIAQKNGIEIDIAALEQQTGCKVFPVTANKKKGIEALKTALAHAAEYSPTEKRPCYPSALQQAIDTLLPYLGTDSGFARLHIAWGALKLLEGDASVSGLTLSPGTPSVEDLRRSTEEILQEDIDITVADARYRFIGDIVARTVKHPNTASATTSAKIDRIVLNRVLGIPIFLFIMYLMFMFTINLGSAFIDFFDVIGGAIFVDGFSRLLDAIHSPEWLKIVLANGIGNGIQTVSTFIPVIACLFIFLSILEDSGYMARAAFVMDRLMRFLGLPGKSFVPLIVGFGCNVPAIMATRTLETPKDRLMTMTMAPFMSCGARLPIYALFAVAFFPDDGQNLVFLLYLIGIGAAILTGLALKYTLMPSSSSQFIMELPPYHLPTAKGISVLTWRRLKDFILRAGQVIVPMVMVLNILNVTGTDGSFGHQDSEESVLSAIGKTIVPLFKPIGLTEDNWPAAVGAFTGILAKEAVVGTLNALYDSDKTTEENTEFSLTASFEEAVDVVRNNLAELAERISDPLAMNIGDVVNPAAAAAEQEVSVSTYANMRQMFGGRIAAFAYLLLILLYFPCVAVLGAVSREAGLRWAAFMAGWSTAIGYGFALVFYQTATLHAHPFSSVLWISATLLCAAAALWMMRRYAKSSHQRPEQLQPHIF